mgnify:CR=1 FL=1
MRVQYDVMVQEFARVLEKKGFRREDAESAAVIFCTEQSGWCVFSRTQSLSACRKLSGKRRDRSRCARNMRDEYGCN